LKRFATLTVRFVAKNDTNNNNNDNDKCVLVGGLLRASKTLLMFACFINADDLLLCYRLI
jgi:hypothetical protein